MKFMAVPFENARDLLYSKVWFYQWAHRLRALVILGRFGVIYSRYCRKFKNNPKLATNRYDLCTDFDINAAVNEIRVNGYSRCTNLSPRCVDEILKFCETNKEIAYYNPHEFCEVISDIFLNNKIVSVARNYLGAEPILLTTKLWWQYPPSMGWEKGHFSSDIRTYKDNSFHFDIIDFQSLTFFVYLTDVDLGSAPHIVIERTAQERTLRKLLNRVISDDEAQRKYDNRIVTIVGPRGTAFFEDVSSYHKVVVAEKPRLALRGHYALQRRSVERRGLRLVG